MKRIKATKKQQEYLKNYVHPIMRPLLPNNEPFKKSMIEFIKTDFKYEKHDLENSINELLKDEHWCGNFKQIMKILAKR